MINKLGKILLVIVLLSCLNINKVSALDSHQLYCGVPVVDVYPMRALINLNSKVLARGTRTETNPYIISDKLYVEQKKFEKEEVKETYLNVKIGSNSAKDKIEQIVKDNQIIYFEIDENTILPGKIKINVIEKYNNDKLWLYKYNKDTNKIEYVKNEIIVTKGEIIISIDNSGEYFLTLKEINNSMLSEQLGINLVYTIVFISTILIGGFWTFKYAKEKTKKL